MEQLQPHIGAIGDALVSILVVVLLGIAATLRTKVNEWLASRTTAAQREILHKLAAEGAALAETTWREKGGPEKLSDAVKYVEGMLRKNGIEFDPLSIQAAIEKAVQDFNAQQQKEKGALSIEHH
ncbi:phage holin [Paenibacillus daejeonensis]|uniref:phage holin n=1 Tax=Paenibacillus daejeonensis TaxID=135193 RepID=UPI00035C4E1D|nr:phage holin [Paenibacillus daejeonensis]